MSVQSDLAVSAKCYCFDPDTSGGVLVYLLAKKAGLLGTTPQQLASASKCYCFDDQTYRSSVAYLWESISGLNQTPAQLASASKCYCFDQTNQNAVVLYLLNSIAGTAVAATSLPSLSKCYCFDWNTHKGVVVYLLETISALGQTPLQLANAAKCFCFDRETFNRGVAYLLNSINGGVTPPIHNITDGLVNWWKFDENAGTSASDSADASTGSFVGSPLWVPGVINSGLSFNGTTTWLQLSANTGVGTGAFTVTAWVNLALNGNGNIIYDANYGNPSYDGFWFSVKAGRPNINIVGELSDLKRNCFTPLANSWTYIVATWDGTSLTDTTAHIYINTVEDSYLSSNSGSGAHTENTSNDRFLGGKTSRGEEVFSGSLDDIRVYNRVLTPGEISNMYQWRGQP